MGGFTSELRGGSIGWCSRAGFRMIEVAVSVRMQNLVTTASRWLTSITAIEDPAVLASHVVGIDALGRLLHQLDDEVVIGAADANDGADTVAQLAEVDGGAVAADDAGRLQLLHALGHGRLAQVHAAAQFGHGQACVGLQLGEDAGVVGVQGGVQGKVHASPSNRR